MLSEKSKQELLRFLITGILAVGTDFSSYYLLMDLMPIDMAKGTSFILGSIVAFILNKMWTFESNAQTAPALLQFSLLYTTTFFANVLVNHLTLAWIVNIHLIGFLFATATSTVLNFIGMKFWVFKSDGSAQSEQSNPAETFNGG